MGAAKRTKGHQFGIKLRLAKVITCFNGGQEPVPTGEIILVSESRRARDYSSSALSSRTAESEKTLDHANIEEDEMCLQDSDSLTYEVAKAMVGRMEYLKGNVVTALHVFEGINIAAVTPKIELCIASKLKSRKIRFKSDTTTLMSVKDACLLVEAIFLKTKSLQVLGRHKEAAQSCKIILDTVESVLPEGVPVNFGNDYKLQEIISKAVELLPELWKLAGFFQEAISSYRRALLHQWNLDGMTTTRIQKEFSTFLLYGGIEASPPDLRYQTEGSFVPRNNTEEAVLLLMILLRKVVLKKIEWDPSTIDHLSFALSVSGDLGGLASQIEGLLPGILDQREVYHRLTLCYHGEGKDLVALNLLRKLLSRKEDINNINALLLASKLCGDSCDCTEEGVGYANRALSCLQGDCEQLVSVANCLLGISLSLQAKSIVSDCERTTKECDALKALEAAGETMKCLEPGVLFHLALENAELRKLDIALYYVKEVLKLEAGSNLRTRILCARILSAQKRFGDAEIVINDAIDHTGKWEQGELLRTKAKLQIAQGQLKNVVDTYTHLLAILRVRFMKGNKHDRGVELETWHDLADVYMRMSLWRDAGDCLSKSESIYPHSASRWHMTGLLYEAKGHHKEALEAFTKALDVDPTYVPSLVSAALNLRNSGNQSIAVARQFLKEALRLDKMNHSAWYNLGLLYKDEGCAQEAAKCFETATVIEESAPVEPFR